MIVVTIKNFTHLAGLPKSASAELKQRLTFPNPAWVENEKRGFSNWQTPAEIRGFIVEGNGLTVPRGFYRFD